MWKGGHPPGTSGSSSLLAKRSAPLEGEPEPELQGARRQILGTFDKSYTERSFTVVPATFTKSGDLVREWKEVCRSNNNTYTIERGSNSRHTAMTMRGPGYWTSAEWRSSCQLKTTVIGSLAASESAGFTMMNRPSAATSYDGG